KLIYAALQCSARISVEMEFLGCHGLIPCGYGLADDRKHIGFAEDEERIAVECDFGSAVLTIENLVANLELHGNALVLLVATRADSDYFSLHRLFLGGVRNEKSAAHLLGFLERANDDPVRERCNVGAGLCGHIVHPSCYEWH